MELDRALSQLSAIHAQVLRSEVFRGFRALPSAITSVLALSAGALQAAVYPAATADEFVMWWIGVATLSGMVCAIDLWFRVRGVHDAPRRVVPILMQFAPAPVLGAVVTAALLRDGSAALSMLPGIWAMVTGLGIMASRPYLPRAIGWAALYYVISGAGLVWWSDPGTVPSPWTMGLEFGLGQTLVALVLFVNLERPSRG